jgi:hypothetical protein
MLGQITALAGKNDADPIIVLVPEESRKEMADANPNPGLWHGAINLAITL